MRHWAVRNARLVGTVTALFLAALLGPGSAPAVAAPVSLTPMADARVDASTPAVNFGTITKLHTDGAPVVRSYLRFDVQGWVRGSSHATLQLTPSSALATGLQISAVADTTWGERTITFANAPALGATVATTAAPKTGVVLSVDVTAAISGNGPVSLAVSSSNTTAEALASREAGAATSPQLVVDGPAADTTPPAPILTGPADGALLRSSSPAFTGTAGTAAGDAGTVTVLVWPGTDTAGVAPVSLPAAALAGGAFSVSPGTPLADGLYTALVEQRDGAGNIGRSPTRSFTIDTQAPSPVLTAPAAGSTTSDTTPLYTGTAGTAARDASTVSVLVWQGSDTTGLPLTTLDTPRDGLGAFSVESPTALADGVYSVRVVQADAAGNSGGSAVRTFTVARPAEPPSGTVTLTPAADARVDAAAPTANFGTIAKLHTDASPLVRSFLRFDVRGWVPGSSRATLRLTPTSSLNTGLQVVRVADTTWGEKTITAANAPPTGSLVATTAPPKTGVTVSVDVSAAIAGNGLTSLALTSPDTTSEALASREAGATGPQLVIDRPDLTAPVPTLTAPADGALLASAPVFAGTGGTAAGDAATVTILLWPDSDTDEPPLRSVPAAVLAAGDFSAAPDPPLLDGSYTARVEQRDSAGNVGLSPSRSFTLDTTVPGPVLSAPADGSTTPDSTPVLAGTAGATVTDASSVSVLVWRGADTSGAPLMTIDTARDGGGAFSVESPTTLDDGLYTARVRQTDSAGHVGTSPARSFTVDTLAPPPTLTEPADGTVTPSGTPTFAGAGGTAAGDSPTVSVAVWDGSGTSGDPVTTLTASADPGTGAYTATPGEPLAGGVYTARAEQTDAAGNRGTSASTTFTVDAPDATAPKPRLTQPAPGSATNDNTPTLSGAAGRRPGDADSVRVLAWTGTDTGAAPALDLVAPRAPDGTFSVDAHDTLPDGAYSARVEQDDSAGNHGSSPDVTFTVDTAAPRPLLTQPADGDSTNNSKPSFTGTAGTVAGDANSVAVLVWRGSSADGDPLLRLSAPAAAGGAFSVAPALALEAGVYTARVEQLDAAENRGLSAPTTFTFTGAPDPTIAAAGDIACAQGGAVPCHQMATSDLLLAMNPDAVLALGDTQYERGDYPNYLAMFDPSWGRLKAKIYPALGNHEYLTSLTTGCDVNVAGNPSSYACGYFDYFNGKGNLGGRAGDRGKGYYAFDVGRWRIYAVNSNCSAGGAPGCAAGGVQEQWLRADLAAHPTECQIMFMHHPLFTSDTRQFDTPGFRAMLRPLWQAFYDFGGELVLTGHSHFYERFVPQTPEGVADADHGIQQIISGTGGRNVYDVDQNGIEPNSVVHNGATFGVLQLALHATSYDWRFVPTALGPFTDSGSRACHGPPTG